MAGVTVWLLATILFVPPIAVPIYVAMRSPCDQRLAAVQLASGFGVLMLAALSFAFDQPSFIDLALSLALLSVPGTYLLTIFMERWL